MVSEFVVLLKELNPKTSQDKRVAKLLKLHKILNYLNLKLEILSTPFQKIVQLKLTFTRFK